MKPGDTTPFDAYYKWLAIAPHEQPPNHYRLLGVDLFEQDLDVIAAAADRQMAHVKCFASGMYASHSQRLLNELAAARICLLNPQKKAGYDLQLQQRLSVGQLNEQVPILPEFTIGTLDLRPHGPRKRKRRSAPAAILLMFVGGAVGLLAGYGALVLIQQRYGDLQNETAPKQVAKTEQRPSLPEIGREPFPRQRIIERPLSDALVDSTPISPVGSVRRPTPQPPIPNLEDRIKRRKRQVDDPKRAEPVELRKLPEPSIVVPLTLDAPTILVLATPAGIEVQDLQCDIGLSQNLLHRSDGAAPNVHEIVVERLGNQDKHTAEFAASVADCQVGLDISIVHRNSTAVCDIRPRFSLPSGDVQPFTIRDLEKHRKSLATLRNKVEGAKSSMSRLQATRDRQLQRASNARRSSTARGGNLAAESIARSAAQAQASMAEAAVERANKKIAEAQNWISKESAIQREQKALDDVSTYADRIAADGSIYIRFYAGEITVPASVK